MNVLNRCLRCFFLIETIWSLNINQITSGDQAEVQKKTPLFWPLNLLPGLTHMPPPILILVEHADLILPSSWSTWCLTTSPGLRPPVFQQLHHMLRATTMIYPPQKHPAVGKLWGASMTRGFLITFDTETASIQLVAVMECSNYLFRFNKLTL